MATLDPKIVNEFKKELKALLGKYRATLGVNLEGDTHGLVESFEVSFNTDKGWCDVVLNDGYGYIEASDLD